MVTELSSASFRMLSICNPLPPAVFAPVILAIEIAGATIVRSLFALTSVPLLSVTLAVISKVLVSPSVGNVPAIGVAVPVSIDQWPFVTVAV